MRIGELAELTGASVRSLRYYQQQGLLFADRTASGQRVFSDDAVERVRLLRRLYRAGLTSATIASLLPCVDTPSDAVTAEALSRMHHERERIDVQLAELATTRDQLSYLIETAHAYHRTQVDRPARSAELVAPDAAPLP